MSFWFSTPFSQEQRIVLVRWRACEVQVHADILNIWDEDLWVGVAEHLRWPVVSAQGWWRLTSSGRLQVRLPTPQRSWVLTGFPASSG